MRKSFFCLFIALLMLAGIPGMVLAGIVSHTFIGTIESGYRMGSYGTGSFSYDDALLLTGDETLNVSDGLTVTFSFDSQSFTEANDVDFDAYPELEFSDFQPVFLNYLLVNGESDVAFRDDNLAMLTMGQLTPLSDDDYDYESAIYATPVPIPGALWLLGSGLVGLVGLRRRNLC